MGVALSALRGRAWAVALAALTAAALLAACSPDSGEPPVVVMGDPSTYSPAVLTVPAGTRIIWLNGDTRAHTVSDGAALAGAGDGAGQARLASADTLESGDIQPGATWSYTFSEPGTYLYACRYHAAEQMIGTITVTGGA
jgi:plastocyanin